MNPKHEKAKNVLQICYLSAVWKFKFLRDRYVFVGRSNNC